MKEPARASAITVSLGNTGGASRAALISPDARTERALPPRSLGLTKDGIPHRPPLAIASRRA